ncbi:MAG TPA: amidohydrolase [Thermococcaceae archaeon]|uniref:Bifunctional carboxypeptidase/aminoacylase n=1 Tax=Thermococcus sibiricus TaxID=172049 RepID=A0A101EME1_9EURY|nr:amidohydrolase [Thermococcus sibiricus]KUK17824.1 MAG: Bifunctional carboxypeptidase/aminoacylase [Thermococcus sibiricus]KUK28658.1 MAG: Bifunctional carboxypeptidase/aminoacylase [Thermococcus sp. 40_45]HII66744.1 amidohydrolase [Thermococcaceae archaeon]
MNPLKEALKIKDQIIAWRRDFHMHPELGYEEERTSKIVEEHLKEWGYRTKRVGTGIIADIGKEGKTVALRADMDALPVQEENDVPYKSRVPGKMHACGHDAHTAMLLGASKIIAEHKEELPNKVRLIFQPAEEGGNGALKMIEDGALKGVDAIFGLHVWMELPSGIVGIREGPFMAGVGRFDIEIEGKGGHGASPHETIDPVPIAAQVILAFQTIISRNLNPLESGVVSVGTIKAGEAFNVIPERVYMNGTYRFFTQETKKLIEKRIEEVLKGIVIANNASYKLKIEEVAPPTINDSSMASLTKRVAQKLGLKVEEVPKSMGSEDFSFYLQKVPGAFIALGIRNEEKRIIYPHHHPKFNVDEEVLPLGMALEVGLAFGKI